MRTKLRGKVTLLFVMLGLLLAVPTVALAADLLTEAELSSDVNARTEVAPNGTTNFDIKVWARGNIPNNTNVTGNADITNAYTMGAGGSITTNTGSGSTTTVTFAKNHNYGADGQTCPATVPVQPAGVTGKGCATDPFVVPATITVGNLADGTNGTLTVSAAGSNSLGTTSPASCSISDNAIIPPNSTPDATDCTSDQGFVTVASPNTAPVAVDDNYNVNEDGTLSVPDPGVLGNDTDADNNPLTVGSPRPVSGPTNGSLQFHPDGSFDYTPEANFFGVDTFTYVANDGTVDSNVATVTITVASVNDVPTCQNVAIVTDEDTEGSVAANCSDADGDTLTYAIVDQAADGTASVDGSDLKYDPELNFNGSDSFTYSASDGTASSDPADVDVTVNPVNDPPPTPGAISTTSALSSDGTFTLNWGASIDVDGDNVTYTLQKRDANDANWSQVASGLTSSSYTFGGSNPAEDEGTWDYRVKAVDSPAGAESDFRTAENLVKVDKSAPNAPTLSFATTGQSFKATVSGVDWYKDSAKIDVAANGDPALADTSDGSGVDAASLLPNPFDVTQNGTSTASRKVKDNATNESAAGTLQVHVDAANPTLGDCPTAGPFILGSGGGTQTVGPINASDGESGVDNTASTLSGTVNTSTVGEKTVTFTAKDNVGHSSTPKQCTYNVNYNWDGFRQPVDNLPTLNTVKAGQSIPMKFSLSGNQGLNILQPSTTTAPNPKVTAITCPGGSTPMDAIEQTTTANNGLTYDATADQYNYVWKTQSTYSGKCYRFDMTLIDGTTHSALFKFSK